MNRFITVAFLSLGSLPVAAQTSGTDATTTTNHTDAAARVAEIQPTLAMTVDRQDNLFVHLVDLDGRPFIGALIASLDNALLRIQGLPPLLSNSVIVASGFGEHGALTMNLGPVQLPFTVFVQGIGLPSEGDVLVSSIEKVGG